MTALACIANIMPQVYKLGVKIPLKRFKEIAIDDLAPLCKHYDVYITRTAHKRTKKIITRQNMHITQTGRHDLHQLRQYRSWRT